MTGWIVADDRVQSNFDLYRKSVICWGKVLAR